MFKDIFIPSFLVVALSACSTNPARPTVDPDQQSSSLNKINMVGPTPTPTELYPGLNTVGLLTPAVRVTAQAQTQVAFAAKDPETLAAEGFSEVITKAQRTAQFKYTFTEMIGNKEHTTDFGSSVDVTLINIANSPHSDFILGFTAGHGGSVAGNAVELQKDLQEEYPAEQVTVTGGYLTGLALDDGDEVIDLPRNTFGLDVNYQRTAKGQVVVDSAVFVIRKSSLSPTILAKLENAAIPASRLSFAPFTTKDKLFAICIQPDTKLTSAVLEGAKLAGTSDNIAILGPSLIRPGYSGCAVTEEDQIKGIVVADNPFEQNVNLVSFVYPLSTMGERGFWDAVARAVNDPNLAK